MRRRGCVKPTTGDSAEALLARCVPDLQLDPFVVQQNLLDLEVDPAGGQYSLDTTLMRGKRVLLNTKEREQRWLRSLQKCAHPMVVMKLDVKESSEKRRSTQLFPTPEGGGGAQANKILNHGFDGIKQ